MGAEELKPTVRTLRSIDIMLLWIGAGIGLGEIWAGNYLAPALPLVTALMANLIGHIIGNWFMGAVTYAGSKVGVPTMVLSRGAFGVRGSYLLSILNYSQLIGWTAVMIIVTARAMDEVMKIMGLPTNYYLWVVLTGLICTAWAFVGPKGWKWLERASVTLLLALSIWMTLVTLQTSGQLLFTYEPTHDITFAEGVDLVAAMPISWVPLVADYSRFAASPLGSSIGTYIGYFIGSGLCYAVGSVSNACIGARDPISLIAKMGLGVPALLIVILSTVTTTFLDIYSAGITIKNILVKGRLIKQIILAGILGTVLAIFFPMEKYEWFLLWIGASFFPAFAIVIVDYFVIRGGYDAEELFKEGGAYWYFKGFNPLAIACWALGFLTYVFLIFSPAYAHIGATIPTITLAALVYLLLSKLAKRRS